MNTSVRSEDKLGFAFFCCPWVGAGKGLALRCLIVMILLQTNLFCADKSGWVSAHVTSKPASPWHAQEEPDPKRRRMPHSCASSSGPSMKGCPWLCSKTTLRMQKSKGTFSSSSKQDSPVQPPWETAGAFALHRLGSLLGLAAGTWETATGCHGELPGGMQPPVLPSSCLSQTHPSSQLSAVLVSASSWALQAQHLNPASFWQTCLSGCYIAPGQGLVSVVLEPVYTALAAFGTWEERHFIPKSPSGIDNYSAGQQRERMEQWEGSLCGGDAASSGTNTVWIINWGALNFYFYDLVVVVVVSSRLGLMNPLQLFCFD